MTPNPRLSHLLIIFIFTIAACSPAPTQPPVVFDIENSVDALPTVTAAILSEMPTNSEIILTPDPKNTLVPQAIPTGESSIQFPEWVSNSDAQVFLAPVGTFKDGYKNLALFNAETSERFDIPFTSKTGDYFWMPDGSEFGFLHKNQGQITLFAIKEGLVTTIPTPKESLRFLSQGADYVDPIHASASTITDSDFFLVASWNPLSPDRKHFIYQENYDETYTSIFDISSNEIIYVSDPNDEFFDLFSEWSPDSQFLAIVEVDEAPLNYNTFETLPTFRLRIYDMGTQQVVASYKNVTFPKWSPDGTKFLFQEWKKLEFFTWYAKSPPCIFDTISGATTCYNETTAYHKKSIDSYLTFSSVEWSPDQTMIGYIYSTNEQGGFCTITLFSGKINCLLEKLESDDQNIIEYMWSPDGSYIVFEYDTVGPYSDDTDRPQVAIANIRTGKYFTIGDNINLLFYPGLWRPLSKP